MNKWITLGVGVLVVTAIAGIVLVIVPPPAQAPTEEPRTFAECVEAGYPVMESHPRRCNTPSGKTFIEDIGNAIEKQNLIRLSAPQPGATITSPLTLSGEARGYWYFEASFPYELRNAEGTVIAQGPIQAQGEWMTEEFVPFSTTISFPAQPAGSAGTLVLKKANPSGLPENDDQLTVPVVF